MSRTRCLVLPALALAACATCWPQTYVTCSTFMSVLGNPDITSCSAGSFVSLQGDWTNTVTYTQPYTTSPENSTSDVVTWSWHRLLPERQECFRPHDGLEVCCR